jgi:hypothetical protein
MADNKIIAHPPGWHMGHLPLATGHLGLSIRSPGANRSFRSHRRPSVAATAVDEPATALYGLWRTSGPLCMLTDAAPSRTTLDESKTW